MASIAAVLATYEPDVIRWVTDPRTGISTSEKFRSFMPNSGELKAYCDEQQAVRDRINRYGQLPKPNFAAITGPPPSPTCRANLRVRPGRPGYEAMLERTKSADPLDYRINSDSIDVPLHWYQDWKHHGSLPKGMVRATAAVVLSDDDLRKMYAPPNEAAE